MRKLLAGLVISLFAILAVPGVALASHQAPWMDFLSGAAKSPIETPCGPRPGHLHTNANTVLPGVPDGADGQFWVTIDASDDPCLGITEIQFSGEVTCVNATGKNGPPTSGWWRGIVDKTSVSIPNVLELGSQIYSRHIDNGEPGAQPTTPEDRAFGFVVQPSFPPIFQSGCPPVPISTTAITQGNLVVHDGI